MTEHPITPPPELLDQWADEYWGEGNDGIANGEREIATQAARWGADMELEACVDAIYKHEGEPLCGGTAEWLRTFRRPKPPRLKEQALEALRIIPINPENGIGPSGLDIIRRALEALPND